MSTVELRFTARRVLPHVDWLFILIALALTAGGIMTIWGASSTEGELGAFASYARAQSRWLVVAFFVMIPVIVIDYRWSRPLIWPLYIVLLALLVLVYLRAPRINGAKSWFILSLGGGFKMQFQPAEAAKIIVIMALAHTLSLRGGIARGWRALLPFAIVALPAGLIFIQPDLGTSVVFIPVTAAMLWASGMRKRWFVALAIMGVAAAGLAYPHLRPYQQERIKTFLNPGADALGKGYNVIQAQTTLGSGGLLGKGWGRGTQTSFRFLPEYQTDFVFPTLGEQFGFVGCAVALFGFAAFMLRATTLALRSPDLYGSLLVVGFSTVFITHIGLNIGMTIGLLPVTGLPLPFFSYGGTFLLTCYVMVGMMISVAARREG